MGALLRTEGRAEELDGPLGGRAAGSRQPGRGTCQGSRGLAGRTRLWKAVLRRQEEGVAEVGLGELSTRPLLRDLLVSRGHKPKSQLRGRERGWGSEVEQKVPPREGVWGKGGSWDSPPYPYPRHVGASRFTGVEVLPRVTGG